jgi:predicted permease
MEQIIWASAQASIKITVMGGCGAALSRLSLLDKPTSSRISRLLASFLIPCMLFVSITPNMSWQNLVVYWLLPVALLVYTLVGIVCGFVVALLANVDRDMYRFVVIACSFGNTTSLPLALITSLAVTSANLSNTMGFYPIKDGLPIEDTPEQSLARGVAYVFIVLLVATLTRWTFLYRFLVPANHNPDAPDGPAAQKLVANPGDEVELRDVVDDTDEQCGSIYNDRNMITNYCLDDLSDDEQDDEQFVDQPKLHQLPTAPANRHDADNIILELGSGRPVSHIDRPFIAPVTVADTSRTPPTYSLKQQHPTTDNTTQLQLQSPLPPSPTPSSTTPTATPTTSRTMRVLVAIKNFICGIEVPAWAALVSVICGLIPSVRYILFESPAGYFKFFTDALTAFGDSVVPMTLLTLGVSMSEGPKPTAKLGLCTTLLILVTRLFVIPLFGILFLYLLGLASMLPLGLSSLINQPEHGDVLSL